jgi:hypothetical protein
MERLQLVERAAALEPYVPAKLGALDEALAIADARVE